MRKDFNASDLTKTLNIYKYASFSALLAMSFLQLNFLYGIFTTDEDMTGVLVVFVPIMLLLLPFVYLFYKFWLKFKYLSFFSANKSRPDISINEDSVDIFLGLLAINNHIQMPKSRTDYYKQIRIKDIDSILSQDGKHGRFMRISLPDTKDKYLDIPVYFFRNYQELEDAFVDLL